MKPRSFVIAQFVLAGLALATWMLRQSTDGRFVVASPCVDSLVTASDHELRVGPIESLDDTGTTVIVARPRTK